MSTLEIYISMTNNLLALPKYTQETKLFEHILCNICQMILDDREVSYNDFQKFKNHVWIKFPKFAKERGW